MTMIKFDLYEEYQAERKKSVESIGLFTKREQEAKEAHEKLVKEYEDLIKESVATGKDASKELDKLDDKIVKASRLYERRKEETSYAGTLGGITISRKEIIDAYYSEFMPKVQESVLPSVDERLEQARNLILSAITDVKQAIRDYDPIATEIKELSENAHKAKETDAYYVISNPINDRVIRQYVSKLSEEIDKVSQGGELPADVEYMKEVK